MDFRYVITEKDCPTEEEWLHLEYVFRANAKALVMINKLKESKNTPLKIEEVPEMTRNRMATMNTNLGNSGSRLRFRNVHPKFFDDICFRHEPSREWKELHETPK